LKNKKSILEKNPISIEIYLLIKRISRIPSLSHKLRPSIITKDDFLSKGLWSCSLCYSTPAYKLKNRTLVNVVRKFY